MDTVKETKKAIELATGKRTPKAKSVVNNVTEYGALFNRLNTERSATLENCYGSFDRCYAI